MCLHHHYHCSVSSLEDKGSNGITLRWKGCSAGRPGQMRLLQPCSPHRAGAHAPPGVLKPKPTPRMGALGVHSDVFCRTKRGKDGNGKAPHGLDIHWRATAHASENTGHHWDRRPFPAAPAGQQRKSGLCSAETTYENVKQVKISHAQTTTGARTAF